MTLYWDVSIQTIIVVSVFAIGVVARWVWLEFQIRSMNKSIRDTTAAINGHKHDGEGRMIIYTLPGSAPDD